MKLEEKILSEYKKYNLLNNNSENAMIKIFVSYIKPSFLFKSEILTPIHLGRAVEKECSKDGVVNDNDIKWLHENCLGDDDFEGNISNMNRRIGFLTGTYWAWKNYDKLGNPLYFGSFGYRKFIVPSFLDVLLEYDVIAPSKALFKESLKEQFINAHGKSLYDAMLNILQSANPGDMKLFNEYLALKEGYFHELYVMKRDIFFNFCDWVFHILFTSILCYHERIDSKGVPEQNKLLSNFLKLDDKQISNILYPKKQFKEIRDLAFIFERLTGFYLYKLSKMQGIKMVEVPFIIFKDGPSPKDIARKMILNKMREKVVKTQKN